MKIWLRLIFLSMVISHSSLFSAEYFVSTTGNDSNLGTLASPWLTLTKAVTSTGAGNTATFLDGDYTTGTVTIAGGTGVNSKLTLRAKNTGSARFISNSSKLREIQIGSFTDFIGFKIQDYKYGIHIIGNAQEINVTDCNISACVNGVFTETSGSVPTKIHFLRVVSHDNTSANQSEGKGFFLDGITNSILEDCEAFNNYSDYPGAGDGFGCYDTLTNVQYKGCYSHNNRHDGFDIWQASTFINCRSYDNGDQGFKAWGAGSTFTNCIAYYNQTGFNTLTPGAATTTLINCNAISNGTVPHSWVAGGSLGYGVRTDGDAVGGTFKISLKNCILYGNGRQELWIRGTISDLAEENYNIFHHTSTATTDVILVGSSSFATADIGAGKAWNTFSGKGGYSFAANPMFISSTSNFGLQLGSPAIDTGTPIGAPLYDIAGNIRPAGLGYEIGAYEYGSGGGPTVPPTVDVFSKVKGFPNPFNPAGSSDGFFKFANLYENTYYNLKIYTMNGELVREIYDSGTNNIKWDGKNSSGNVVARGGYVYVIMDPAGNKKVSKVMLLK